MGYNWQEPEERKYSFFWQDHLLRINAYVEVTKDNTMTCSKRYAQKDGEFMWLTPAIEPLRQAILDDFKQAFSIYDNSIDRYTITFKF
jgi:hypothetical protein